MKKAYSTPVIADYGSIADCTFATPALGGDPGSAGDGTCSPDAGTLGPGGKSAVVMLCDKFGEYSHS